jgi:hypothetical protein
VREVSIAITVVLELANTLFSRAGRLRRCRQVVRRTDYWPKGNHQPRCRCTSQRGLSYITADISLSRVPGAGAS